MGLRYKRLDLESTGPFGSMFLSQPAKGSDANAPVVPAPGVPGTHTAPHSQTTGALSVIPENWTCRRAREMAGRWAQAPCPLFPGDPPTALPHSEVISLLGNLAPNQSGTLWGPLGPSVHHILGAQGTK